MAGKAREHWTARFFRFVHLNAFTGCWDWYGYRNPNGYARFGMGRDAAQYAHRLSYRMFVGPIPDGFQIDHLCRNRRCVNPEHLEAVSAGENTRRGFAARGGKRAGKERPR